MKDDKIGILIEEIMYSMSEIKKASREHMPPHAGEFRLPPHQFHCLNILYRSGTLSMGELADKMAVSNQQLTRIVDSLVENNLAERFTSSENRRVVLAQIGEGGKEIISRADEHIKKKAIEVLSALSEQDIDELTVHVRSIKNILLKVGNKF